MDQIRAVEQSAIIGMAVDQIFATIDLIKADAGLAKFDFRATNRWVSGGRERQARRDRQTGGPQAASGERPFDFQADQPAVLLGTGQGANPVELVLTALAGCLTTSLVYLAAVRGIKLEEVESRFEGKLDLRGFLGLSDEVPNGYENVKVTVFIKADAPAEQLQQLIELAERRSPVIDTLTRPVPIQVDWENLSAQ
jgi:uncharacterized OsmC-like protein